MNNYRRFHLTCGTILLLSEIWKQLTLTYIINSGQYIWWYFPFQLCSLPMYCCLIIGFTSHSKLHQVLSTFLIDYGLLGGIFVFFDTSGMHYSYFPLTIHSYSWHILLIVIGATVAFSGKCDYSKAGFLKSTSIYSAGCILATVINLLVSKYDVINLFYINPLYSMEQKVFCQIADIWGNTAAILFYISASIVGAFLLHLICRYLYLRQKK